MEKLFFIGKSVLCNLQEDNLANTVEGALVFQTMFQNLEGPLLKEALPVVIQTCTERKDKAPMNATLERAII